MLGGRGGGCRRPYSSKSAPEEGCELAVIGVEISLLSFLRWKPYYPCTIILFFFHGTKLLFFFPLFAFSLHGTTAFCFPLLYNIWAALSLLSRGRVLLSASHLFLCWVCVLALVWLENIFYTLGVRHPLLHERVPIFCFGLIHFVLLSCHQNQWFRSSTEEEIPFS